MSTDLVNRDFLGLTDTVRSRLSLDGDLRVPVLIKEDKVCSSSEVDAKTTSPRGDEHDLESRIGIIEHANAQVPASASSLAIKAQIVEQSRIVGSLHECQKLFNHVQCPRVAGKDQYLFALLDHELL